MAQSSIIHVAPFLRRILCTVGIPALLAASQLVMPRASEAQGVSATPQEPSMRMMAGGGPPNLGQPRWTFVVIKSGSISGQSGTRPAFTDDSYYGYPYNLSFSSPGGWLNGYCDFQAIASWVYADGSTAPNPPNPANFLETGSAVWNGGGSNILSVSGSANNGLGDPHILASGGKSGQSSGKHIISFTDQGARIVFPIRTLSANASESVSSGSTGVIILSTGGYSAIPDPRGVVISRGGRYEKVDSDGSTIRGDTVYSYILRDGGDFYVPNTLGFTARRIGTWSSSFTWSWSGGGISAPNKDSSYDQMPFGRPVWNPSTGKWSGTPTGLGNEKVIYFVNDSDGAQGKAKYSLNIHDRIENLTDSVVGVSADREAAELGNGGHAPIKVGPIGTAQLPITDSYTFVIGGAWSFSVETPAVGWFPVFGLTYSAPSTQTEAPTWNQPIASGYFIRLFFREAFNDHTVSYFEYDALGQVRADPNDPTKKSVITGRENIGKHLIWKGPFSSANGF